MRRAALLGALGLGALAPPAQATTICVPAFHAACPDNGANVAQADLETALNQDGADGVADRIVIAPGLITALDAHRTNASGLDALEIVGAGRAATTVTTSQGGDNAVLDFDEGQRAITVRDLTVRIPASFTDGAGRAIDMRGDVFERVDIESRNPSADGIALAWNGGRFSGGRIYGSSGGSLDKALSHVAPIASTFTVEDAVIENAAAAVESGNAGSALVVRRSRLVATAFGVRVVFGPAVVENTVIVTAGSAVPISVEGGGSSATNAEATVRHVTVVGAGVPDGVPALRAEATNSMSSGTAKLTVTDSVVHGFQVGQERAAGSGPDHGDATIDVRWSFLPHYGASGGDGETTITDSPNGSFAPSPLGADLKPFPGSPVLDAGDPGGALAEDLAGTARPLDGNGDGVARRDMGAFEAPAVPFVPPVTPPASPPAAPPLVEPPPSAPPPVVARDTVKPRVSRLRIDRAGRIATLTLSEAARVEVTLKRPGRKAVRLRFRGSAGANRFTIGKRRVRARRQQVTVVATDAAGNRSAAARTRAKVRR